MTDSRNIPPQILRDRSEGGATGLGRQPSDQRACFSALSRAALGEHGFDGRRVAVANIRCDVFEARLLEKDQGQALSLASLTAASRHERPSRIECPMRCLRSSAVGRNGSCRKTLSPRRASLHCDSDRAAVRARAMRSAVIGCVDRNGSASVSPPRRAASRSRIFAKASGDRLLRLMSSNA